MKDGRTHLVHKAEHAVDMATGAIVTVALQPADVGDTATIDQTLEEARENLDEALKEPETKRNLHDRPMREIVADNGHHSNAVMRRYNTDTTRTYISEPDRGRRNWKDKPDEHDAVYANRRRIPGKRA